MKEIQTSIVIDAPAFSVWAILVDFVNYPNWNPLITRIKGELKQGNKLNVEIKGLSEETVMLTPLVGNVEHEREIRWFGVIGNGLFSSEHKLTIEPITHNRVIFFHSEKFTGPLVSIAAKKLDARLRKGFEEMNKALKNVAELSWKSSSS